MSIVVVDVKPRDWHALKRSYCQQRSAPGIVTPDETATRAGRVHTAPPTFGANAKRKLKEGLREFN